jgi:hypothetical protein
VGLWVNASDRASLRAGMLAVAADRGAGDGELLAARTGLRPAADLVWQYLDRSSEPWLLVLDNADEPEILRGWQLAAHQPAGHCRGDHPPGSRPLVAGGGIAAYRGAAA